MNMNLSTTSGALLQWDQIDFPLAERSMRKLQKRIAEAFQNDNYKKMEYLQHTLIHSFYARALAVKSVTSTHGKKTPGIDHVIWDTSEEKSIAILTLRRRGYQPKPNRRCYIPKRSGKLRPLSIPTMHDRAMQTLYRFALEPIEWVLADPHSFAYLPGRNARDAVIRVTEVLMKDARYQWFMKADIAACFDNISHGWVLEHIYLDKPVLKKMLEAGYVDNGVFHKTNKGIPQGSPLSSVICNLALDRLETLLHDRLGPAVQFVRYADDIIILGDSRNLLVHTVTPIVSKFLSERGLSLSSEKTRCAPISDGISFLGWEIYKGSRYVIASPCAESVRGLLEKIGDFWQGCQTYSFQDQCKKLSSMIRGWCNYYKGIASIYSLYDVEYDVTMLLTALTGDNRFAAEIEKIFNKIEN